MSKSGFSSEKVMHQYFAAMLTEDAPVKPKAPQSSPALETPVAAPVQEEQLKPVEKLLKKVTPVIAPEPEAPKARVEVEPEPVMELVEPQEIIEVVELPVTDTQTIAGYDLIPEQAESIEEAAYRSGSFQALFFKVAGLTVAVPLTELGGIHNISKINTLIGKPSWFKGVMVYREATLNVVDTARWVMPEKLTEELESQLNYEYLIVLKDSAWGLACEQLVNTVTLSQDDVKWREQSGKRPWLAGLIKEKMCALLDVDSLIELLDQGLGSQDE
jgi:purine-binding chemotaxis protein CheW